MTRNNQQRRRRQPNNRNRRNGAPRPMVRVQPRPQQNRRRRNPRNRNTNRAGPMQALGGMLGSALGYPKVGRFLGSAIGKVTGSGEYTLSMPVNSNSLYGSTPPAFGEISGATRIRHREYIRDIVGSTAFAINSFSLNPGNSTLFPWLSYLAGNYEQYHLHGFVMEFKSTSSNALNSTNTALGTVGMVTQYDPTNPDFTTKQQAENYSGSQATGPNNSLLHFVECAPKQNVLDRMYVRTGPITSTEDLKFYDLGKVQVFTSGMQASATIGELWVSYDIEFYRPKIPDSGLATYTIADVAHVPFTANINSYIPAQLTYTLNKVGSTFSTTGNFSIQTCTIPAAAPAGRYLVTMYTSYSSTAAGGTIVPTLTSIVGGAMYSMFNNGTQNLYYKADNNGCSIMWCFDHYFQIDTVLTYSLSANIPNTTRSADVFVICLPSNVGSIATSSKEDLYQDLKDLLDRLGYLKPEHPDFTLGTIKPRKKKLIEVEGSMETIE